MTASTEQKKPLAFSVGDRVEFADPYQEAWQGGEGAIVELPTASREQYKVHIIALPPTNVHWKVGEFMWDIEENLKPIGTQTKEAVDHPDHYGGDTTYEVFKVVEAWGLDEDAYLFNVIKYVARAKKKGKFLEDLKKARVYIDRRIKQLEDAQ